MKNGVGSRTIGRLTGMWPFRRCHCFLYALLSNGCRFRIWNSKRWMWIWCIFLSWSPKSGSFVWMMSHSSVEPTNGNSVVGVVNSRPSISRWLQLKSAGSEHEPVMSLRSSKIRSTLKRVGAFAVKTARAGNREGDSTGGGTAVLFCTVNRRTVPNVGLSEVPTKLLFMMICVPAANWEKSTRMSARSVMPSWTCVTTCGAGRYPPSEPMIVNGTTALPLLALTS